MGMLEAADQTLDVVSPFLGAIFDRCRGCTEGAQITTVFTKYIDLVHRIYQKGEAPGWTEEDLRKLGDEIRLFKELGK